MCTYEINISSWTRRYVIAALSAIEGKSGETNLRIDEGKTYRITTINYTFDVVKEFVYLSYVITNKTNVNKKIKCRTALINRGYFDLNRRLGSRDFSRTTELILSNSEL